MRLEKIVFVLLILLITTTNLLMAESEKEKDFAVPAFSDLQLLNPQTQGLNTNFPKEQLDPLPVVGQMRWMDLNKDLQLNDFDVKQFQSIIESLRGEKLTGLQLTIRFRTEQKNQKESFPLLYDLDRDGMFTAFDVDAFSDVIDHLDSGADRGNELVQKFKFQFSPQDKK